MTTNEALNEYIDELVARARTAQKAFEAANLDESCQHRVDEVTRAVGKAVCDKGVDLAAAAVAETGMGDVMSKVQKMFGIALITWNYIKGKKSIGVIDDGKTFEGVRIVAKPMGVVAAVMPSTNPIATIIHNSMCALKCRNAIIIAPHPASAKITQEVIALIRAALKEVGAPEDLVQCISADKASIEATGALLRACDICIGTGGPGMVKACYSSGKPALGVGQGNAQSIIDADCPNMGIVCGNIVGNRAADQGVPCTGEQTVHIPAEKEAEFVATMQACGAYLIEDAEVIARLRDLVFPNEGPINRKVVGRNPQKIGAMLGIEVPDTAKVLLIKLDKVAGDEILCREIMFPIVRYHIYDSFESGVADLLANLYMEGAGHSSAIWSNNQEHIEYAANRVPVGRFHVNQNSGGGIANGMPATSTIGCGTWGGNSMSENLSYVHLMNKTHVTTVITDTPHAPDPADWDIWE